MTANNNKNNTFYGLCFNKGDLQTFKHLCWE